MTIFVVEDYKFDAIKIDEPALVATIALQQFRVKLLTTTARGFGCPRSRAFPAWLPVKKHPSGECSILSSLAGQELLHKQRGGARLGE